MKREIALAAATALLCGQARGAERDVAIDGGKALLHGSLLTPHGGATSSTAVLFISGSGPTDRNGDSAIAGVKPANLRLLAEALDAQGITSLRFDKRGIGASRDASPPENELRFQTFAQDAAAWARFLKAQPGVKCVVIAGHSEGSLLGMLAAQQTPVCGFVSIAGAGRPIAVVMREQLASQLPRATLAQVDVVFDELKAGREVPGVPETDPLFRPSIQPYLISWIPIDPAAELRKVKAQVLIVQGDRDIQVDLADARALAAARPDARLAILPGVNHILKAAPADRAGNIATYADPKLPIDPQVTAEIFAFLKSFR